MVSTPNAPTNKASSPSSVAPSNGTDGAEIDELSNNVEGLATGPTVTVSPGSAAGSHAPGLTVSIFNSQRYGCGQLGSISSRIDSDGGHTLA
jgi:hypothetical protein